MFNKNQRKLGSLVIIILTLTFLLGCAAKKPFWGDKKTGFILTYRMDKDQTLAYKVTTETSMGMEMMGQLMDIDMNVVQTYSIKS